MKIAAYGVVAVEAVSMLYQTTALPTELRAAGFLPGLCGVALFGAAVWTMRDSWRPLHR